MAVHLLRLARNFRSISLSLSICSVALNVPLVIQLKCTALPILDIKLLLQHGLNTL